MWLPIAGVFALVLSFAAQAGDVVKAELKGCPHDGTSIGGVNSCGKIWKLKSGHAQLGSDGSLKVEVKVLVLNDESTGQFNGSPRPGFESRQIGYRRMHERVTS